MWKFRAISGAYTSCRSCIWFYYFFGVQLIRAALTIVMKQRKNTELYAGRAAGATSSDSTMLLDNICDLICFFYAPDLWNKIREKDVYMRRCSTATTQSELEKKKTKSMLWFHFSNIYKQHSSESHASALFCSFFHVLLLWLCCGAWISGSSCARSVVLLLCFVDPYALRAIIQMHLLHHHHQVCKLRNQKGAVYSIWGL